MFSFLKKSSSTLGIIYDIGGSSIRAGIVLFEQGKVPHIVYTAREAIPFQQIVNPQRLFSLMLDTLRIISLKLVKEGLLHLKFTKHSGLSIDHIFYIFSSPWSVSESKKISIHKDKPFEVTDSYIKNLVNEQEALFEKEFSDGKNEGFKNALVVVDKQVTQVKLNGYETSSPHGKHASRVDVSSFISLVPKDVLLKVEDFSISGIKTKDKKAYSLSLVALSTIRDAFKNDSDFIFLDVTSTLTDITIVKDGIMLENASFPLGKDFLIDKLAKTLSSPYDVTRSTYRAYLENNVDEKTSALIRPVVLAAQGEWFVLFQNALQNIATKSSVPRTVFLIVSNTFRDFFTHAINEDKFNQFNNDGASFKLVVLDSELFKDKVVFSKNMYKDPFITIEAIYINKSISL